MTLNEFIFDSLENFENIHIDYESYTKELTPELYDELESFEVENWYLDIKKGKACVIVKVEF